MAKHYENSSAGMVILTRENKGQTEVLLQYRNNTKMLPHQWDTISGHVEAMEFMRDAVVREAMEEINIVIKPDDLKFLMISHNQISEDQMYYNIFFTTDKFEGIPEIMEPHKHTDLKWFPIDKLPENIVRDRKIALDHLDGSLPYIEFKDMQ